MATLAEYWTPGETTDQELAALVPAICIAYVVSFILWGAYVCLFGTTMWVMRQHSAARGPAVLLVVGIFVLCTINTLADLIVFCRGFGAYPDGAVLYWNRFFQLQVDRWSVVFVDLTFNISTFLADGLLIWRAYVVWGRKPRIIWFPAFFLVLAVGAGLMLPVVAGFEAYRGFTWSYRMQVGVASGIFYGSSWIVTWYGTIAIAARLYSVGMGTIHLQQAEGGRRRHPYRKIILVVLESGFMLSMSVFVIGLLYVTAQARDGYTMQTITAAIVLPPIHRKIVGIVPTLMLLQLNIGRGSNSNSTHRPSNDSVTMRFAQRPSQTHNVTSHTGIQFASATHTKDTRRSFELNDLSDSFVLARSSGTGMTGSIDDKEAV